MTELDAERTAAARRRAATRSQRMPVAQLRRLTLPAMILADVLALALAVGIAFAAPARSSCLRPAIFARTSPAPP